MFFLFLEHCGTLRTMKFKFLNTNPNKLNAEELEAIQIPIFILDCLLHSKHWGFFRIKISAIPNEAIFCIYPTRCKYKISHAH